MNLNLSNNFFDTASGIEAQTLKLASFHLTPIEKDRSPVTLMFSCGIFSINKNIYFLWDEEARI